MTEVDQEEVAADKVDLDKAEQEVYLQVLCNSQEFNLMIEQVCLMLFMVQVKVELYQKATCVFKIGRAHV